MATFLILNLSLPRVCNWRLLLPFSLPRHFRQHQYSKPTIPLTFPVLALKFHFKISKMPSLRFKSTPLFGGALLCDLPTNFMDVRFVLTNAFLSIFSLLH